MARSAVDCQLNNKRGTKVKTGCATCRIRKVKCDEKKPACDRCTNTGRSCDGYDSLFRLYSRQPRNRTSVGAIESHNVPRSLEPTSAEIAPKDIDLLNRYFSTKTIFDVDLGCDEEARQILQASLTDPPIRHAVSSLKALREDLETSGDDPASAVEQTPSYRYGLQQYSMALGGLASKLTSPSSNALKSALLCCQILISIEQVRKNYAAMAQHIIQGLRIMHEYRARPSFVAGNKLVPAYPDQLPFLDVFIIKLFAAPCKFADAPSAVEEGGSVSPVSSDSPHLQPDRSCDLRTIAPDMRTQLIKIATSTLEFLGKVSQADFVEVALQLLSQKKALLDKLESWLVDLELAQAETGSPNAEPVSVAFLRVFYAILRIVLLGALDSSIELYPELQAENDRLQSVANDISERVKSYTTSSGTRR